MVAARVTATPPGRIGVLNGVNRGAVFCISGRPTGDLLCPKAVAANNIDVSTQLTSISTSGTAAACIRADLTSGGNTESPLLAPYLGVVQKPFPVSVFRIGSAPCGDQCYVLTIGFACYRSRPDGNRRINSHSQAERRHE